MATEKHKALPQAETVPQRRWSWAWLITLAALIVAAWLGYQSWTARGLVIRIDLPEGHGLHIGDPVRFKGTDVGVIRSIRLGGDLDGVVVTAALDRSAAHIARAGARFWVVRPQFAATGIAGLETIVGPRYLAALPGGGAPHRHFVGLTTPPIVDEIDPGDLEIILESATRGGLRAGAPVLYRSIRVGTVLSVGLTSDGGAVEARVHIEKAYVQLIRPETRFFPAGGLAAHVGIRGVSVEFDSIESLLVGGVALATPPGAGDVVRTGHRYRLAAELEDEWLDWQPVVLIGSSFLPPGAAMPAPQRAVIGWESGRWLKSQRTRRGWVLPTEHGLLGPLDLFRPEMSEDQPSVVLEVAGKSISLNREPIWNDGRLALIGATIEGVKSRWPTALIRSATEPEECIAIADPSATPMPLSAARMAPSGKSWTIDPALMVDESWHGACVLSRADGALLGLILVANDATTVALLPPGWPRP